MHAPTSLPAKQLERWAEKVTAATNGRLTFRHYAGSTLIPPPETRKGIKEGAADIGAAAFYGVDPEFEVGVNLIQLNLAIDTYDAVKVCEEIYEKFPDLMASQWKSYKVLWIIPSLPTFLYTVNKPVYTLEDIKGQQIRVPNKILADMIQALGGTPVSMSTPDWLVSLDKGTTDGGATTTGFIYDFKIGDKFKYSTMYSFGSSYFMQIMNLDTWNSLPQDLQDAIDGTLEWGRQDNIDTWAEIGKLTFEYQKENGVELISLPPDEVSKWDAAIKPIYDAMAADMDAKGYPGTELVNFSLERSRFYNSQQQ
jgi:TRAP-type C4-dicarboxylate transport system substrate-binding protein